MCLALTSTTSKSASRMLKIGFQYTPVLSSTTCVQPASLSQSANSSN